MDKIGMDLTKNIKPLYESEPIKSRLGFDVQMFDNNGNYLPVIEIPDSVAGTIKIYTDKINFHNPDIQEALDDLLQMHIANYLPGSVNELYHGIQALAEVYNNTRLAKFHHKENFISYVFDTTMSRNRKSSKVKVALKFQKYKGHW